MQTLAWFLDQAFRVPGTRFRFGADSLIGLIPVVGDLAGALISGYVLLTAARLGVPRPVITRMLMNVGLDAVAGSVPFVGDLLDAGFKSNSRNLALLQQSLAKPQEVKRSSRWLLVGLAAAVFAVAVGGIALAIFLANLLTRNLG